jgi:hypothetical protein
MREACLESKEPTSVEMKAVGMHQEVPNEEAEMELSEHWRTDMETGI